MSDKLTVKDLKMWLQGVEEMQSDDWVPNATQWKKIREKIDQLNDDGVQAPRIQHTEIIQPAISVAPNSAPTAPRLEQHLQNQQPEPFTLPNNVVAPVVPPNSTFLPTNHTMPAKTPNIDTTDGTYRSGFV